MVSIKNIILYFPYIIIIGLIIYMDTIVSSKNTKISELHSEIAKQSQLKQISETLYQGVAQEVEKLTVSNDSLMSEIRKTKGKLRYKTHLSLMYKNKIDSIKTYQAISDTQKYQNTIYITDSTDRVFKQVYDGELVLEGYFNTSSPYNLFIKNIELNSNVEVTVVQNADDSYTYNVDTHSRFLKPSAIEVSVVPHPKRWEYFYGVDVVAKSVNLLNPSGIGLHVGAKRGNYSGRLDIRTIDSFGAYVGVSISKYIKF